MANEWVPVKLFGPNGDGLKIRYTIANDASVSIGQALQLLDPYTVSLSHLASAYTVVASEEHIANKGVTDIACWTWGDFDVSSSGSISVGDFVVMDKSFNHVKALALDNSSGSGTVLAASIATSFSRVLGRVLEASSDAEVVTIRRGPI